MNDLAKNLLLWVIVAVVLMVVFQAFGPRGAPAPSDGLRPVHAAGPERPRRRRSRSPKTAATITGERKDGSKFTTISPGDKDLVNDLIEHKVEIEQRRRASGPSLLVTS